MNRRLKALFSCQKAAAKIRSIDFLLTFEEWLKIWIDSGHLHERGRRKDQYVMARFGDVGPYAVDNVKIVLQSANMTEQNRRRFESGINSIEKMNAARLSRPNACIGRKHTKATKEKMRLAAIARYRGVLDA